MTTLVRPFNREAVQPPRELSPSPFHVNDPRPLDVEIGCGVGFHPIQYARANPNRRLIAIEHTREKFSSFEGRVKNHDVTNLWPVHADAVRFITHEILPHSIDRVFLLYPNPEPQAANKRWFRMPFFHELLTKLKSGATLHLATNVASYAAEAKLYAKDVWNLDISRDALAEGSPRTHFEKKYLARGETCFDLVFTKT